MLGVTRRMKIRAFQPSDEAAVVALWQECGLTRPWNDPHADIARKLTEQPEFFLVGSVAGEVVATVMIGFDGHRGWAYYLAVSPRHRRRSYGQSLMREAERLLMERGCPKLNLLVRSSNAEVIEFYRKLGYVQDDVVSLGRRLIHDQRPDPQSGANGRQPSGSEANRASEAAASRRSP
jgi:ribosomal protein S18 acetylase RimI-like enzyme